MEAEILLQQLCERYHIDPARGQQLLPLIKWALKGPTESRERIIKVVEQALSASPQTARKSRGELIAAADFAILLEVARVLHDWSPENTVLDLDFLNRPGAPDPEVTD